jgi:hypothetical protein
LEEWKERNRINLTKTLNSLQGAKEMEGDKYVLSHYFVLLQSVKIWWGNGGRGSNKFDRDSKFSGGSPEEWKTTSMFYYIILFYFNSPNLLEEWRESDRINFKETLNSLEGAGGMEGDKYVLLHYFVLFQSSKICWRTGGRGTE